MDSTTKATIRLNRITSALCPVQQDGQVSGNATGMFSAVQPAPPDAIFLTKKMFLADKDSRKVNLGIGAYRTDEGKPMVLKCVKKAEQMILDQNLNKEYLGQGGYDDFCKVGRELVLGKGNPALTSGKFVSVQSLSGTGALRLTMDFLKKYAPGSALYYPNPTWGNHNAIAKEAGVVVANYRYWDPKTRGLDFAGMIQDITNAPKGSVICLHACAHNPTGVDPTPAQWVGIADAVSNAGHFVLFDSAYQGFASGDLDKDAHSIRLFTKRNIPFILCQSFAKNIGLYNERVGCLHMFMDTVEEAVACKSQAHILVRRMYSNPPAHGARIVHTVLSNDGLNKMWQEELAGMAKRIISMRHMLRDCLVALKTPGNWDHIVSQIGMFSFTGLSKPQCEQMIAKHHVYMLKNGRISMAGVTSKNAKYIAEAINDVVRTC